MPSIVRPPQRSLGARGRAAGDAMTKKADFKLHVSNGDATDLPGTGLVRRIIYWRDSLHEGPVPAVGPEELRQTRAAFLARGRIGGVHLHSDRVAWRWDDGTETIVASSGRSVARRRLARRGSSRHRRACRPAP
jgi:hypothetical protein